MRNVAASVRDRLTARARLRREDVQLVFLRYAIERLLYRLSVSNHHDRFILKGAMLFAQWAPTPHRPSGDLDLLGLGDSAPDVVRDIFREVVAAPVEDDGVLFLPDTLVAEIARPDAEYGGVSVDVSAEINGAKLKVHIDVGYGDAITPAAEQIEYPSLLDQPRPKLLAYPRETVVAEKFQAMVELGMANTRLKDFFDLWAIANTFEFDGETLAEAIARTFDRRDTDLPAIAPLALTPAFAERKQREWAAFLDRTDIAMASKSLPETQAFIATFVLPPVLARARDEAFDRRWTPDDGWMETA